MRYTSEFGHAIILVWYCLGSNGRDVFLLLVGVAILSMISVLASLALQIQRWLIRTIYVTMSWNHVSYPPVLCYVIFFV